MRKSIDPPDLRTWNFSICAKDEIKACFFYECCRELPKAAEYFALFEPSVEHVLALNVKYIAHAFSGYPLIPWLGLPEDARRDCLELLEKNFLHEFPEELVIKDKFVQDFARNMLRRQEFEAPEDQKDPLGFNTVSHGISSWAAIELDWSKSEKVTMI